LFADGVNECTYFDMIV